MNMKQKIITLLIVLHISSLFGGTSLRAFYDIVAKTDFQVPTDIKVAVMINGDVKYLCPEVVEQHRSKLKRELEQYPQQCEERRQRLKDLARLRLWNDNQKVKGLIRNTRAEEEYVEEYYGEKFRTGIVMHPSCFAVGACEDDDE